MNAWSRCQCPPQADIKGVVCLYSFVAKGIESVSRGMKIYAALLLAIGGFIVFKIFYEPAEVRALNALLMQNEQLSRYPYPFRVLRLENGAATVTSPRSASVPVPMIIRFIEPSLSGVPVTDERYLAAQRQLAGTQALAQAILSSEPNVERVIWTLDDAWLRSQGMVIPTE